MVKFRGKEVIEIELDGIDPKDAPDFADAFICSARWASNGYYLDDDSLIELQDEQPELIYELVWDEIYAD